MQKGIKFRIYPNREQQNLINQTLGCCRLIYNKGLSMRNEAYENGNKIGYSQTSAMLTELKKCEDFAFLKVVDSIALQQSLCDLDRGFVNFLQKQSTMLIRENQTICIEELKVRNMMRNHKLAQHIGSASWSKFFDMLAYKSVWYGNDVVKVPTMYPSSQICSCCGYKNPLVKNLAVRVWECPECHTIHDRDTNASINILNKGLQMQSA